MKIKKRTKERKGRIPDQRSKRSKKGKEAILDHCIVVAYDISILKFRKERSKDI